MTRMPLYSSFSGDEVVLADDALPVADNMMERTEGALVDEAWGLCSCALAALQELGRHLIALRDVLIDALARELVIP